MFDAQQLEGLSQVFMPFCKYTPNPAVHSILTSLYNVHLVEYTCSDLQLVWRSQLDPIADVADHLWESVPK